MRTEPSKEKPPPVLPLPHRACVIARQQAAAHEDAQQPPAHLHLDDGVGLDPGGGTEDDPARGGRVEDAVDDDAKTGSTVSRAQRLSPQR